MAELYEKLASRLQTPIQVPDSGSQFSDINQYFESARMAPVVRANLGASQAADALEVNQREKERAAAKANQVTMLKKKRSDMDDVQRVINERGGFDFVDGTGNKISPKDYAMVTGRSLPSVFEGSLDPRQQEFVETFKGITDIADTMSKFGELDAKYKNQKYVSEVINKRRQAIEEAQEKGQSFDEDEFYSSLPEQDQVILGYDFYNTQYPDIVGKSLRELGPTVINSYKDVLGGENLFNPTADQPETAIPTQSSLPAEGPAEPGMLERFLNRLRGL